MRAIGLCALLCVGLSSTVWASEGLDRVYTVTVRLTQPISAPHPIHLSCTEDGDNRTPATVVATQGHQIVQEDQWTSTGQFPLTCTVGSQTLHVPAPKGQRQVQGHMELKDAPAAVSVHFVHD